MLRKIIHIPAFLFATGVYAQAQGVFSYSAVPLQEHVQVELLGSDKTILQCYNLYGYNYITPTDSFYGEFIVAKSADTFRHKTTATLKFCRIKEFYVMVAEGICSPIPVEMGIEVAYPGKKEKVFLNFDPAMPDALFVPCK